MTKKASSFIQILLFAVFIGALFMLFLLLPDTTFSQQENRELAQAPKFSLESLFSRQFTTKFESYTTDQFPFRDSWTTLKARSELFSGKNENKGIYLCGDGALIEGYEAPDPAQLNTNVAAVQSLAETAGVPVYFCLVPGAAEYSADTLPKNAPNDSQRAVIDSSYAAAPGAQTIDMYSALAAHKDEYIFYRTDHHWTSLGAYYGYEAIMTAMGYEASPLSSFERQTLTEEFYGTIYSKSGMSWVKPDTIESFAAQAEGTRVFNYVTGSEEETALYDFTYLEKKDKYSVFFGGISPLIKVTSDNTEAPSLLILRDSYADSLIPFMQSDFSEIYIMDLRYYKTQLYESSVADFIAEHGIDEVLVCYSTFNFGTDINVFLMG